MTKKELSLKSPSTASNQVEVDYDLLALLPRAETSDFDIPRLTLIQPTSKIEGSPGDVIDSGSGVKVTSLGQKFVFAPVWFFKDFTVSEVESKKFRRNEPKTPDNAHFSVFDNRVGRDPDGVSVKRDERLNLFLVQASTLDDDFPRLYRMVIKPSSFKEAKKFLSEWDIQIRSRLAPFSYLWSVTPKQIMNEKGKFCVYEFAKEMEAGKQTQVTSDQLTKVGYWVKTLSSNKDKVMKTDDSPEDSGPRDVSDSNSIPF